MPDKITQVNRDVRSDIQVGIGTLGKLKAGQVAAKTDVVAKNLFDKYPNADRILIVQMMAATYCPMVRDDKTLNNSDKRRIWTEFSDHIFKFENPEYNPPPTSPPSKKSEQKSGAAKANTITKQSATAKVDSATGTIHQNGDHNVAIVGNNDTVSTGPSSDDIAEKVAKRLGPTVRGGFHEVANIVEISLGSVTAEMKVDEIRKGGVPFSIAGTVPIQLRIEGDRLLFSFRSWDANLPIEVQDNQVSIGNNQVDRNFAENAFEVVNMQGEPIFQMIRKNANSIQINGIFPTGRISSMTGMPLLMWVSDETGILNKSTRPENWRLKAIFKYPSWKYPGEFAD